ncbi:MAG: hypothetical protein Q9166_006776 [cf. Caloplaca sp. 2 TL-2023]
MAARVSEYEALLQDLSDRVSEADQATISRVMNKENQDVYSGHDDSSTPANTRRRITSDELEKQAVGTERQAPGRKGSTESLDYINEDLNRTAATRATGFMGKNSEVNWLDQLRRRTDQGGDNEDEMDDTRLVFNSELDGMTEPYGRKPVESSHLVSESTYHCDDISLVIPDQIQIYHLPPRDIADLLLTCYLECVHPAFPILGKTTFVKQYRAFYDNPSLRTGPAWLAILNLLFAIAARYSRLIRAEWIQHADDDHTYFSRARLLGLSDALWVHAELQRIQVISLTSFYLMATNQINR